MTRPKRRWGDNDRHFGPFTLALGDSKRLGFMLDSGYDESPGCHLRLYIFTATLLIELPAILRPYRRKITAGSWDAATVERMGRDWYWHEYAREFGFSIVEGAVHFHYGAQTMDSSTDHVTVWFPPWNEWRHVRHTLYGLDGFFVWAQLEGLPWDKSSERIDSCPSASFEFYDFDDERITAKTRIEEREWLSGVRGFKWLSLIRKPRVARSLDIQFSSEVGKRKGSWKGGTVGHSIDLLPSELHVSAFRRYCDKHAMTFVGATDETLQE